MNEFCITDVGSTTTKAILFRRPTPEAAWTFLRREAPTTVEKPAVDVTVGVLDCLRGLEAEMGRPIVRRSTEGGETPAIPYLSTSSAGGGLAMVVTGLVREITSRSAERVALGAGAILLDVIAMDDGRTPFEKIGALRSLRPDMVLLAGGFDGDATTGPVFLAELIREAGVRPKLSPTSPLPVIYAGNENAADYVRGTLGEGFFVHKVPNIRPTDRKENLEPAREAIHALFMEHVISQAPGYDHLLGWVSAPVLPTPGAVAKILALASRRLEGKILAIDIGGATTDVFTAERGRVLRTVSANLGMSYSILNVAKVGGIEAIEEALGVFCSGSAPGDRSSRNTHLPHGAGLALTREALLDAIGNKHLRPTRLPADEREVVVERAVATVAVREAVREHLRVIEGFTISRSTEDLSIRDRFFGTGGSKRKEAVAGPFRLAGYDLVIGSGGILSHSDPGAAVTILASALRPRSAVQAAVDREFMFPHLGVLSEIDADLATSLFFDHALVQLGPLASGGPPPITIPAPRAARPSGPAPIPCGTIRVRREMGIAGEVLVSQGDIVEASTVVARSTRSFLRPYFMDVAGALRIDPADLGRYLRKTIGDEIHAGDILAERKTGILSDKTYLAQVGGRIERILPSGVVVVRERPEDARQRISVNVARDLDVAPEEIRPCIRVEVGQEVDRGQHLAATSGRSRYRCSASPVRGEVTAIDLRFGLILISPLSEQLEVRAWVGGRVEAVTDRGCVVACEGTEIEGAWGIGGEAAGALSMRSPESGCISVCDEACPTDLTAIGECGGAGLICGSIHLNDLTDAPPFPIVVTERFGSGAPLAPEIRRVLEQAEGRAVSIDGTTQLRVGVRRPRIVIPDP